MNAPQNPVSTRLATAWRAISEGVRAANAGPHAGPHVGQSEVAMLEALAKLVGAGAARLYYPEIKGDFTAVADWCWAWAEGEPRTVSLPLDRNREGLMLPEGYTLPVSHPRAWALLPLPHAGQIAGVLLLACPALPLEMSNAPDAATCEAIILAARQVGCAIAASRAQAKLDDIANFGAFAQNLAFAAHDIKGISSQLALLASNTERLGANPDFRKDMLLTLRAAASRLDALLDRLAQGAGGAERSCAAVGTDIGSVARAIAGRFASRHQVSVIEREPCAVLGDCAALEQVLTHLVTNAVEASAFDAPVFIGINAEGSMARVEIIDSGQGMSPQFLTTQLFRPFATSKPGGFGIGAYEAREMVRAIGGRLDVESREGVGTRFVIRLPRAAAAGRVAL